MRHRSDAPPAGGPTIAARVAAVVRSRTHGLVPSGTRGRVRGPQAGATLVELVVAIVVLGVAATAALGVLSRHSIGAPDALQFAQAAAVAQALLDEALVQSAGAQDPDGGADAQGPEAGEARGSAVAPFDHVNDYHGYAMGAGIVAFDGAPIAGLEGYRLAMTVTPQAIADMPADQAWWVRVQVTTPTGQALVLEGLRARLDE